MVEVTAGCGDLSSVGDVSRLVDIVSRTRAESRGLLRRRAEAGHDLVVLESCLESVNAERMSSPDDARRAELAAVTVRALTCHRQLVDTIDVVDTELFRTLATLLARLRAADREASMTLIAEHLHDVLRADTLCLEFDGARVGSRGRVLAATGTADNLDGCELTLEPRSVELSALGGPTVAVGRSAAASASALGWVNDGTAMAFRCSDRTVALCLGLGVSEEDQADYFGYLALLQSLVSAARVNSDISHGWEHLVSHVTRELNGDLDTRISPDTDRSSSLAKDLTRREREVLPLILRGLANADIARELYVSLETVKTHVKNILRKSGAANRAELIARSTRP